MKKFTIFVVILTFILSIFTVSAFADNSDNIPTEFDRFVPTYDVIYLDSDYMEYRVLEFSSGYYDHIVFDGGTLSSSGNGDNSYFNTVSFWVWDYNDSFYKHTEFTGFSSIVCSQIYYSTVDIYDVNGNIIYRSPNSPTPPIYEGLGIDELKDNISNTILNITTVAIGGMALIVLVIILSKKFGIFLHK